jgi:nucleoside-diphosphate-sugar epimerase
MENDEWICTHDAQVLVTGANGFLGTKVVETLLAYGFKNIRCFVRPSGDLAALQGVIEASGATGVELVYGNLLSAEDCRRASKGVAIVFHVAAGIEKTFPGCFMNSALSTKYLLDACHENGGVKRFVNVSSFAVYSNVKLRRRALLDETCEIESHFMERFDAYCFGKTKQDEFVRLYGAQHAIPYVVVRPGVLYGPRARGAIHSRVGIGTFGIFLHLGGSNPIPLAYIDNCAEAIVLAGIKKGVDGEVFNVVDDDLPTSRAFLRMYKNNVKRFSSIYVPYRLFYCFCYAWEKYSAWSKGQLPLAFNRRKCAAEWKGNTYSNAKLKTLLGWKPSIPTQEGLKRHFQYFRSLEAVHE